MGIDTKGIDLLMYCEIMKERVTFVEDLLEGLYIINTPDSFDEKTFRKKWKENSPQIVSDLAERFDGLSEFTAENIEVCFKSFIEERELGMGAVLPAFRLTVTGKGMGPSMFQIAELIGKEETISRMKSGIEKLKG